MSTHLQFAVFSLFPLLVLLASITVSGDRASEASLRLLDATMIGVGIFVLTGLAAEVLNPMRG